jgi:hypothetical protein
MCTDDLISAINYDVTYSKEPPSKLGGIVGREGTLPPITTSFHPPSKLRGILEISNKGADCRLPFILSIALATCAGNDLH